MPNYSPLEKNVLTHNIYIRLLYSKMMINVTRINIFFYKSVAQHRPLGKLIATKIASVYMNHL